MYSRRTWVFSFYFIYCSLKFGFQIKPVVEQRDNFHFIIEKNCHIQVFNINFYIYSELSRCEAKRFIVHYHIVYEDNCSFQNHYQYKMRTSL